MRRIPGEVRAAMKVKRAGLWTKLLVLVLLVATVTGLLSMRAQLREAQAQRDELSQQVQEQLEVNAALAEDVANSGDPEYLENIARSRLGLLEPGEIKFVDTSD